MDKSALQRFFLNECSAAERKEVIGWLSDPQNDLLIKEWMKENWDLLPGTGTVPQVAEPDVHQMWSNLEEKLFDRDANHHPQNQAIVQLPPDANTDPGVATAIANDPESISDLAGMGTHEIPVRNISRALRRTWWVAASIIFALGFLTYSYRQSILYIRHQTGFAEVDEFDLPDGSHVVLNANSSLLVPRWGFTSGDREVQLKGEAAFDVKHTINHQKFLVTTNNTLNVEVLGTEFLVYSRNDKNRVTLKQGSVKLRFTDAKVQPILMKPGDVVTADKAGSLSVKHQQPISRSIPWKDHRFEFDSTTLSEVITHISEFFGDQIVIKGETIGSKTITGSFNANSAREVLIIISEIYNLELEQTKDKIILKEKTSVLIDQ